MRDDEADTGWFVGVNPNDVGAGARAIRERQAVSPAAWPSEAIESGYAADREEYFDRLHHAALRAAREAAAEEERAADQQLIHAVRAMDDCARTANELTERVTEWGGSYVDETGTGLEDARELAERDAEDAIETRLVSLATRTVALADERDELRAFVEREAPSIAPNLSALAGPVLAARLIALAGGLEALAKKPSGTVQVLGAEEALFAHLQGRASSPKHGIIYLHDFVSGTAPDRRGSAARALAGKLSIAARVDHYSGDRRPELETELNERIERIRSRGGG